MHCYAKEMHLIKNRPYKPPEQESSSGTPPQNMHCYAKEMHVNKNRPYKPPERESSSGTPPVEVVHLHLYNFVIWSSN